MPDDPGQWLAGQPTFDEGVEQLNIAGGASEKLVGLLFSGDKPRA